jgi:hypothetical protein
MRNNVLFLILISLVISCKTKQVSNTPNTNETEIVVTPPDPFEQVKQRMVGQWDWLKTNCCGRLQNITTPVSTQMTLSRNYRDNYTVELFINDSLQSEVDFKLNFGFRGENDTMLKIGEGHSGYLRFNGDTMVIDHSYMDLQTDWYVRRKQ